MSSFTTRVELHNAVYNDYVQLHAAMEQRNFHRAIRSDGGQWFHLPTVEYDSHGDIAIGDVLELAKAAANETGKVAAIIVTEAVRRQWFNLNPMS
jgi:hypothetical protein